MTKFASVAAAALGLALVAATPAFANSGRAGGPDTQNPVAHQAVAANGPQIQVWGGRGIETRPTASAEAVTGGSDEVATYNVGRLTYRVVKVHQPASSTQVAHDEYITFISG